MALILVTGVTGFIGRHLKELLIKSGHEVLGTTTQDDKALITCDFRDRDQVFKVIKNVKPDVVIHLAALSSVTKGQTIEYYETNLVGTENLLQAVDTLEGRRRIIFVSSAAVYGNQKTSLLSEDLCPLPVSHYGISKFACERLVNNSQNRHNITIVRPFNVIGVGQSGDFIVPKLIKHFSLGTPNIRLGRLEPVRDYIDVDACCDIISQLINLPASFGEVLNICSGRGTSVRELLDAIQKVSNHQIEVIEGQEFIRENEVFRLLGSIEKLNRMLPERKEIKPIEDVVREMLEAAQRVR